MRYLISVLLCVSLVLPGAVYAAETSGVDDVVKVAAQARPSVVGILTTFRGSGPNRPRAAGTGFVYKNGWVITNAHVVEGGVEMKILLPDQRVLDVDPDKAVFYDSTSDIAVIRVDTSGMEPLPFAPSAELQVGQAVIAVGNPLGFRLGNSVTLGILSGMGRSLGSGYPFLQVDAPINPGNSGGPLLNTSGQVIGVNTAKMMGIGMEGLGFSIPSDTAREIADTLIASGKVERVTLGLMLEEGWEALYGIPSEEGLEIIVVVPDGPSGKVGLTPGDKLMMIDEQKLGTTDDLTAYLSKKKAGDKVVLTVQRQGLTLSVPVVLVARDAFQQEAEEKVVERSGILRNLTDAQIQEATTFGERLAVGWVGMPQGYFARSGSNNWATLYTEYMYVARRVSSVHLFGYTPSPGFIGNLAESMRGKLEFQIELNGEKADFLAGAKATLRQGERTVVGTFEGPVNYAEATDGSVVIGVATIRFLSSSLDAAADTELLIQLSDGKVHNFLFRFKDLR